MKSKEIKNPPAFVEWRKGKGECEHWGYVNGARVFTLYNYTSASIALYFEVGGRSSCCMCKLYSNERSAKRGVERFARRLAAIFGKAGK